MLFYSIFIYLVDIILFLFVLLKTVTYIYIYIKKSILYGIIITLINFNVKIIIIPHFIV